jgi:radical SAM superfamily enzyme YgiQ (UPF0313 family)
MQNSGKKILLINPSYKISGTAMAVLRHEPPMALLNLASFLFDKGYHCEIVNTAIEEINWDKIKGENYLLVGITVFIGSFLKNAKQIVRKIREINPTLPICFGGVLASLLPERILSEYEIDYVVRYEGEHTLLQLVEFLEGKRKIEEIDGLSYRIGERIVMNPARFLETDLDKFPIPKWELFGDKCNKEQKPYYFRIMSSKGCPFKCSFCYSHSIDETIRHKCPPWRCRSAKHIIGEIEHIHRITGCSVFTFGDDNFLVKKDRVMEVLSYMKKNNFYIEQCIAHMDMISDSLVEAMAGVVQTVIYAIESASPRLLKLLSKPLDISKIPVINRKLFEKGIVTTHNFMVGLPTETDEELRANVELMLKLKRTNPFVRALTYMYLPLPFTPLNSYVEQKMGLVLPSTLEDYENASFDSGNKKGRKFRPWLNQARYDFIHKYCLIFNDVFKANNLCLSERSQLLLKGDPGLRALFMDIENVSRPKNLYRPYVLDRVLAGDEIDLVNDLKKQLV